MIAKMIVHLRLALQTYELWLCPHLLGQKLVFLMIVYYFFSRWLTYWCEVLIIAIYYSNLDYMNPAFYIWNSSILKIWSKKIDAENYECLHQGSILYYHCCANLTVFRSDNQHEYNCFQIHIKLSERFCTLLLQYSPDNLR